MQRIEMETLGSIGEWAADFGYIDDHYELRLFQCGPPAFRWTWKPTVKRHIVKKWFGHSRVLDWVIHRLTDVRMMRYPFYRD